MSETRLRCGMLVFPNLTQLDLTGPYEVFARLPGAETLLLWKDLAPLRSEHGLTILPMGTFSSCPPLDLVFVPVEQGSTRCSKMPRCSVFCDMPRQRRAMSSGSAPARSSSAPRGCCVGGAPRPTGCPAIYCAPLVPSR